MVSPTPSPVVAELSESPLELPLELPLESPLVPPLLADDVPEFPDEDVLPELAEPEEPPVLPEPPELPDAEDEALPPEAPIANFRSGIVIAFVCNRSIPVVKQNVLFKIVVNFIYTSYNENL